MTKNERHCCVSLSEKVSLVSCCDVTTAMHRLIDKATNSMWQNVTVIRFYWCDRHGIEFSAIALEALPSSTLNRLVISMHIRAHSDSGGSWLAVRFHVRCWRCTRCWRTGRFLLHAKQDFEPIKSKLGAADDVIRPSLFTKFDTDWWKNRVSIHWLNVVSYHDSILFYFGARQSTPGTVIDVWHGD